MIRRLKYLLKITLIFSSIMIFGGEAVFSEESLRVNEIMGSNSFIMDEDMDSSDWIEIYNGSEKAVELEGYGLSDKADKPFRWTFPEYLIQPDEYLLVFASKKDRKDPKGEFHTNFKISSKDDGVFLTDPTGLVVSEIFINDNPRDISYGRTEGSGKLVYFSSPTPGEENNSSSFSPLVRYSLQSGFYPEPVSVSLSAGRGKDMTIYYTTDGTTPTLASKIYQGPITIHENTVIRAISLQRGRLQSYPSGATFFIGFEPKGIPVLSVSAKEAQLWDKKRGLFRDVKYNANMVRDSVDIHVAYFDEEASLGFEQEATMGVVGASSREVMMRPLKINADEELDPANRKFRYKLFPEREIDEYRHFQLRNNNQDGVRYLDDYECMPTMGMRNALFCELFHDQEGIDMRFDNGPVLFFINGKNYGLMNIGEKRDDTGIAENNPSVNSDDVDLVVIRDDMGLRIGRNKLGEGDAFIRHDGKVVYRGYFLDGAVEYEEISKSAKMQGSTTAVDDFIKMDPTDSSQLDPKTFIASMAAHNIACNTDFGMNNIAFWREARAGEDPGPFRAYTFDFDSTFGLVRWREDYDCLIEYGERTATFEHFMSKKEYKDAFIRKIDEFLNGPCLPENALPIVDRLEEQMEPWIEHHLDMWADGKLTKKKWKKNVENLRKFIRVRPKYIRMQTMSFFDFPGYAEMKFSTVPEGAGTIYMDTEVFHTPLKEGPYAKIPMKIFEKPARGYKLSYFLVNGEKIIEKEYTFTPEDGMHIQAVYEEDLSPVSDICINEVVASGALKIYDEDGESQDWIELYNTTSEEIELTGKYLTDDEQNLTKWQFPEVSIAPGGFLVIFASGKGIKQPGQNLHTSFKLSEEPVLLVDSDGASIIDRITVEEMLYLPEDSSGLKYPDGAPVFEYSMSSTPGMPNILKQ